MSTYPNACRGSTRPLAGIKTWYGRLWQATLIMLRKGVPMQRSPVTTVLVRGITTTTAAAGGVARATRYMAAAGALAGLVLGGIFLGDIVAAQDPVPPATLAPTQNLTSVPAATAMLAAVPTPSPQTSQVRKHQTYAAIRYSHTDLATGSAHHYQVPAMNPEGVGLASSITRAFTLATQSGNVSATRSFSRASVSPGGQLTVTIVAANYGGFGRVTETLPTGFTYVSSNLDASQVTTRGQVVRATLQGDASFSYTVTGPGVEGSYTFSGKLRDSDRNDHVVGGSATVTVSSADSLVAQYDANGNGAIEKSEIIQAIDDYLFGEGSAITRAGVIHLIDIYLSGPTPSPTPTPTPTPTPVAPQLPLLYNQFSGTITVGGQTPPNGTYVEARIQSWRPNPDRARPAEGKVFNGRYSEIFVAPNDHALNNQTITFHYIDANGNESQANETAQYNGRQLKVETLNLTFPSPSPAFEARDPSRPLQWSGRA